MTRYGLIVGLSLLIAVFYNIHLSISHILPSNKGDLLRSFSGLVEKTAPSVVNIYTKVTVRSRQSRTLFDDPFFKHFFGEGFLSTPNDNQFYRQNSLGSGVIVNPNGVIVTNQHVVSGADEIRIVLNDRREFDAILLATDKKSDLSFLKVQSRTPLPFLTLSDSDQLKVGDLVLAIGNPFGVGQTVTNGIISAISRTGVGLSKLNAFIQTDAAINPGNSGGALVTLDGKLAGINTAIFSNSGGSHGIGFAIPANMVGAVLRGILETGTISRGWLGASGQSLSHEMAYSVGLDRPLGVIVNSVHRDGVAAAAGIRVGDIITTVNDIKIYNENELAHRIASIPVGDKVKTTVLRDGKIKDFIFVLLSAPEQPKRNVTSLKGSHPLSGTKVANMSPALAEELDSDPYIEGVIITDIKRSSISHRLGFKIFDIIKSIDSVEIQDVNNLKNELDNKRNFWKMGILRNGKMLNLVIKK